MLRLILIGLCFSLTSCKIRKTQESEQKFYGSDNQSATIEFESNFEIALPSGVTKDDKLLVGKIGKQMQEAASFQVQHLFGVFTTHDNYVNNPGIISGQSKPVLLGGSIDAAKKLAKIRYKYSDTAVFHNKLFRKNKSNIEFVLPKDPYTIYSKGFIAGSKENKCTDPHYNSEGDFWYFWNPKQDKCPISADDLVNVTASIVPIPSTVDSYPYYDKMLNSDKSGDRRIVKITYIIGIDGSFSSRDYGTKGYKAATKLLEEAGFKVVTASNPANSPREQNLAFHKRDYDVEVHMMLADPDSNEIVKASGLAMESDDVFIYDGHSGLGGYLSLETIEGALGRRLKLPIDKSQIFFMNGCSTYAYYNGSFFNLKKTRSDPKGSKNLDIVTAGVGAAFDVGTAQDTSFIVSLTDGSRPSWKLIVDRLYRVNTKLSSLLQVNGDEDNPKTARNQN